MKLFKSLLLVVSLLGFFLLGNAQTLELRGEVFNVSEGTAVPGHTVFVTFPGNPDSLLSTTNSEGQFFVAIPFDSVYVEPLFLSTMDLCSGENVVMEIYPSDSIQFFSINVCYEDTLGEKCQAMFWYDYFDLDSVIILDTLLPDLQTLYFMDASIGDVLEWNWDFGDGSSSSEQNPVHRYDSLGEYLVSLSITTEDCESTHSEWVIAGRPEDDTTGVDCQAMFWYDYFDMDSVIILDSLLPDWQTLFFMDASMGEVVEWTWDFGDGSSSNEQNPEHSYDSIGTFLVSLSITTEDCESTHSEWVIAGRPEDDTTGVDCQALFWYDYFDMDSLNYMDSLLPDLQTLYFMDASIGDVLEWNWDFGDGSSSSEQNPVHRFNSCGDYLVSLSITTEDCESLITEVIRIGTPSDTLYSECFAMFYPILDGNNTVTFINESVGNVVSYFWDFGDGETDTDENPIHEYLYQGQYLVSLSIETYDSCYSAFEMMVYVDDAVTDSGLVALFVPIFNDKEVIFQNQSIGDIWNYHWNFGDGETSSIQEPSHTYPDNGDYIVTLGIGNGNAVNTFTMEISLEDRSYKGYFNSPTSVNSITEQPMELKLFPIPVGDNANLSITTEYDSRVQLFVVTMTGELVGEQSYNLVSGLNTIELNTSDYQNGFYLVRVISENGEMGVLKFVK